jgi:hypothetical protein
LNELRQGELCFTVQEATTFLEQSLARPLAAEALAALHKYTEEWAHTRAVGIATQRVCAVIAEVAARDTRILTDPPLNIFVDDLGDNGVRLQVHPTVVPADYWAVRNDLRTQIKARCDAEGIKFAVPQRNVRLENAGVDQRQGGVAP